MFSLIPQRTNTEQPIARLRDEFSSLLDRFFGRAATHDGDRDDAYRIGDLEIDEREEEIILRADLPGFEPDELDTQLSGRLLTIKAEKQESKKKTGDGRGEERSYRYFQESVLLPDGIQTDGIDAKLRNGVLEVHVPKSEEAKPKRITVKA